MRTPEDLIGKKVNFFILDSKGKKGRYYGSRSGTVVAVDNGPRKGFRGVTVMTPSKKATRYITPIRLKVTLQELSMTNHPTGVVWYKRLVHLNKWLAGGAA